MAGAQGASGAQNDQRTGDVAPGADPKRDRLDDGNRVDDGSAVAYPEIFGCALRGVGEGNAFAYLYSLRPPLLSLPFVLHQKHEILPLG